MHARFRGPDAAVALACVGLVCAALGCAPIDVTNTVTIRPRPGPSEQFGGEQLAAREFVADYVQIDARLLIELRELQSCVTARHVPVLRVEKVHRSNRGFVIWDFALGTFTGAFAALAFAQPRLFSDRLIDGTGREVYDYTGAYVIGGVFAAISAGLLAAGIVDAHRSRDTTRYADAFEVELGPEQACADSQPTPLAERGLRLVVAGGVIELEAVTDASGRARFELPAWDASVPAGGRLPAVIEIATLDAADIEPRVLVLSLRVPFAGMTDAHTGVADTRRSARDDEPGPLGLIEGPQPAASPAGAP
ncbi:hypothetical protein ENSA7_20530 [Enhygromyxa salina]|uniref:Lipoprotein n=1 Tax=Enhygromyxa salina TaxID=215803 RepID=A0A2S9YT41_9BACT|nr:hypothetical protein ENSA7_20530 [Enhygromyxa salina]